MISNDHNKVHSLLLEQGYIINPIESHLVVVLTDTSIDKEHLEQCVIDINKLLQKYSDCATNEL